MTTLEPRDRMADAGSRVPGHCWFLVSEMLLHRYFSFWRLGHFPIPLLFTWSCNLVIPHTQFHINASVGTQIFGGLIQFSFLFDTCTPDLLSPTLLNPWGPPGICLSVFLPSHTVRYTYMHRTEGQSVVVF